MRLLLKHQLHVCCWIVRRSTKTQFLLHIKGRSLIVISHTALNLPDPSTPSLFHTRNIVNKTPRFMISFPPSVLKQAKSEPGPFNLFYRMARAEVRTCASFTTLFLVGRNMINAPHPRRRCALMIRCVRSFASCSMILWP